MEITVMSQGMFLKVGFSIFVWKKGVDKYILI